MNHNISMTVTEIFTAEAIAASGVAYSDIFSGKQLDGPGSLQVALTGDGTGKIELLCSNDEGAAAVAFVGITDATTIVEGLTVGSGFYTFTIPTVSRFVFKVTETAGLNGIGVTAILAMK